MKHRITLTLVTSEHIFNTCKDTPKLLESRSRDLKDMKLIILGISAIRNSDTFYLNSNNTIITITLPITHASSQNYEQEASILDILLDGSAKQACWTVEVKMV